MIFCNLTDADYCYEWFCILFQFFVRNIIFFRIFSEVTYLLSGTKKIVIILAYFLLLPVPCEVIFVCFLEVFLLYRCYGTLCVTFLLRSLFIYVLSVLLPKNGFIAIFSYLNVVFLLCLHIFFPLRTSSRAISFRPSLIKKYTNLMFLTMPFRIPGRFL